MKTGTQKLLLFDVDGTLITSAGAGETAVQMAVQERFGIYSDLAHIEFAGATDSQIAREILEAFQLPITPENITALLDTYLKILPSILPQRKGYVLPGIRPLLERLKKQKNLTLALLTGNIKKGAEIKLGHFGVWEFFEFGAFADDHHDRNQLGHFAKARAQDHVGIEFSPEHIFVIGDTPKDIACGRAIGAKTVVFATGRYSVEALKPFEPDYLFENCNDLERVIETLGWGS